MTTIGRGKKRSSRHPNCAYRNGIQAVYEEFVAESPSNLEQLDLRVVMALILGDGSLIFQARGI